MARYEIYRTPPRSDSMDLVESLPANLSESAAILALMSRANGDMLGTFTLYGDGKLVARARCGENMRHPRVTRVKA